MASAAAGTTTSVIGAPPVLRRARSRADATVLRRARSRADAPETDTIARPEMAILWDLAALYDLDFAKLLALAGHAGGAAPSGRQRRRMTVALRAMSELSPSEQTEALRYMAELKARRERGDG